MKHANFTECAATYLSNKTLQDHYGWTGDVIGIAKDPSSQITLQGCKAVCGTGSDYYPWSTVSSTITTWILPVIGMLLQAPFESNAFVATVLAIARWIGSPMASLSYIMWNIKVSGKCALMVDMAISYDEAIPAQPSDFSSIRDSFYILMTMNQYSINHHISQKKEAEGLLRLVLFSKDIALLNVRSGAESKGLNQARQDLAEKLRAGRKRGAVPVYISTMWFLFSLAISIEYAFDAIGDNTVAHDLALGLFIAWLPVLILCSIVDRNPVSSDDYRRKLNKLVNAVRASLLDDRIRQDFIRTFDGQPEEHRSKMEDWVNAISIHSSAHPEEFFVRFAGQGRVRWHYGAAHPILSDIERSYVASHGRCWLDNEEEARTHLVLGDAEGLVWFDFRELWQIASAVVIVAGTCLGAGVLSYYTPTVGLGCRSGGYLIFCIVSLLLLVLEILVWWFVSQPAEYEPPQWVQRTQTRLTSHSTWVRIQKTSWGIFTRSLKTLSVMSRTLRDLAIRWVSIVFTIPTCGSSAEEVQRPCSTNCRNWTLQQWFAVWFFRPMEIANACWLIYCIMAQTLGSYVNCDCIASNWAGGGGYTDFNQQNATNSLRVRWYWTTGTALSVALMIAAMTYVVLEWCLQSNLSADNYEAASRGLRRTRRFRRITYPLRYMTRVITASVFQVIVTICKVLRIPIQQRKTLQWTRNPDRYCQQFGNWDSSEPGSSTNFQLREFRRTWFRPLSVSFDNIGRSDSQRQRTGSEVTLEMPLMNYPESNHDSRSSLDLSPTTSHRQSSPDISSSPLMEGSSQPVQRPTYPRPVSDDGRSESEPPVFRLVVTRASTAASE